MRSIAKIVFLVVIGFATGWFAVGNRSLAQAEATAAAAEDGGTCGKCALPDFVQLSERWRNSVVNIATENKAPKRRPGFRGNPHGGSPRGGQEFGDPFERFFGPGGPGRSMPRRSLGSGFIFDTHSVQIVPDLFSIHIFELQIVPDLFFETRLLCCKLSRTYFSKRIF